MKNNIQYNQVKKKKKKVKNGVIRESRKAYLNSSKSLQKSKRKEDKKMILEFIAYYMILLIELLAIISITLTIQLIVYQLTGFSIYNFIKRILDK